MRVRVEHLDQPFGLDVRRPRLSWQLPPGASRQTAYELRLDDGTLTGPIPGDGTVLMPWPGRDLTSRERRRVWVRVWTDRGLSDWSEPAELEAGLLEPSDWVAQWISPYEIEVGEPGFRRVHRLRGEVSLNRPVATARLYATALGLYELHLNGRRVGDLELTPGYTEYGTRIQVQTYDVTPLLRPGVNRLEALLADGWFRGQVGMLRSHNQFGDRTAFLAQVHIDHSDGSTTVCGTGPSWVSSPTAMTADLIEGQTTSDAAESAETPVVPTGHGFDRLVSSPAPPVRAIREIRPIAVRGNVFDLGENVNGRVRVRNPARTPLTLTHAEALGPDGDVTTDHLRPADVPFIEHELRAGQVDRVETAGVFEPRFTTHGFRYVRAQGSALTPDDLTGVVVHTDLRPTGGFACDDERLNRLHEAAVRSFLGNACDIPTDCPTRERAGWTGDWQLYAPVATFSHDVAGFSVKWLRDLAAGQWENGVVGNMAPMPPAERTGFLRNLNGSAGWGDAIVLVPWEMFQEYGDRDLLAEMWPAMTRWLNYVSRTASAQRHPSRTGAPAPHERFLWDTGFHWGEWLVPGEDMSDFAAFAAADKSDVATAYFARTARVAARIAGLLGFSEQAAQWAEVSDGARSAWQAEFVTPAGDVRPETQANLVRALAFDLVPAELRRRTADRLAKLIRDNGTHLSTGFLATPDLLPVLADAGHLDVAYDLLLQTTPPSWLTMIERGATTVWERWEGIDTNGIPHDSLNHYSKGAVIGFLHRYTAGLQRLTPTWRRFRVHPHPGGGLTSASAWHETPHGRASVEWTLTDGSFVLKATVPPGCEAEVVLPDGDTHKAGPGTHHFEQG
ncbi:family 78 glycoside hydrolase catalytic domain [Actinoplanes sp. LDG1-06]|uniref:alpha-L-rhamnosidase n=1 Tax=Paractinoplanes ovalisporus TaxID=2810368 RepID=A0ABS2ARM4_9ACTN|nr:family 78 glycoside hydrolase catalytic domain [Actinoplanes ovalisporus]MBM2621998.1 family 78 glycoside hydrolase catalytic domain [Actinoplanes ovalisporus]